MPISARCPNKECGKSLKVKDELAGKKVKCPACASVFVVPAAEPVAAVEPAPVKKKPAPPPPPAKKPAAPAPAAPAKKKAAPVLEDNDDEMFEDSEREEEQETAPAAGGTGPGLDKQKQLVMFIGLGTLALLAVSVFLPWVSFGGFGFSGINFTAGIVMLILALGAAITLGVMFALKKPVAPVLPVGAAAGLYALVFFLIFLIRGAGSFAGIGLWIGLLAALGATGTFIFCSIRCPFRLPALDKKGTPPFLRDHGALVGILAIGLILGLVFSFVGGSTTTRGPSKYSAPSKS
jgi:hypothetical protein